MDISTSKVLGFKMQIFQIPDWTFFLSSFQFSSSFSGFIVFLKSSFLSGPNVGMRVSKLLSDSRKKKGGRVVTLLI